MPADQKIELLRPHSKTPRIKHFIGLRGTPVCVCVWRLDSYCVCIQICIRGAWFYISGYVAYVCVSVLTVSVCVEGVHRDCMLRFAFVCVCNLASSLSECVLLWRSSKPLRISHEGAIELFVLPGSPDQEEREIREGRITKRRDEETVRKTKHARK